jgi:Spy/CpxP family protein refolding chaperone
MKTARNSSLILTAALVAGSLVATCALAMPAGPPRGPAAARVARAAFARLGLTDQQKQQLRTVREQYRPSIGSLRAQAQADRAALRAAMTAQTPDPSAVGNAALKLRQDRESLRAQMKSMRGAVLEVLTPEQRAQLKGYMEAWRDLHRRGARG